MTSLGGGSVCLASIGPYFQTFSLKPLKFNVGEQIVVVGHMSKMAAMPIYKNNLLQKCRAKLGPLDLVFGNGVFTRLV